MDDADLVERARAGERDAWGAIYDRYADRLHDHCWSILRDEHEAADALHDAFVAAASALTSGSGAQLRDPARLRPWLYAIARNEAFRRHRRRARAVPTDQVPEVIPVEDDAPAGGPDLQRLVWDAAAGLSPDDQSLLDLHLRQGLEGQELADVLGITANNAYVKLHRLREALERSLGALLVARTGSTDCEELQRLVAGWDGTLSPLLRKRIARHVDACEICGERKRGLVSPLALLGAVPLLPAPAALRDRILDDTVAAAANRPAGGRRRHRGGPRRPGPRVLGSAAVVLLALVAALVLAADEDDTGSELVAGGDTTTTATADEPDADPGPSSTTATTSTTSVVAPAPPTGDTTPAAGPSPAPVPPIAPPGPTAPTTTAPPVTSPPGAAALSASTSTVDLGGTATRASVTIRNTGTQALAVVLSTSTGALSASPASFDLAPGDSTEVDLRLDRGDLVAGPIAEAITVRGGDPDVLVELAVGVVGRVVGDPTVSPNPIQTTCAPDNDVAGVTAAVGGAGTIREVRVHWSGSGTTGSAPMSVDDGVARGSVGNFPLTGTVEVWVVVTDTDGRRAESVRRALRVDPCPG